MSEETDKPVNPDKPDTMKGWDMTPIVHGETGSLLVGTAAAAYRARLQRGGEYLSKWAPKKIAKLRAVRRSKKLPEGGFEWMKRWLVHFRQHLDVGRASLAVNRTKSAAYEARQHKWFADAWDEIVDTGFITPFKASMLQRATYGTRQPLYRKQEYQRPDGTYGERYECVGYVTEHEPGLTKMVAQARLDEYAPDAADAMSDSETEAARKFRAAMRDMLDSVPEVSGGF